MHIVLVLVTIRPEMRTEFEQALLHNARESVAKDRGWRRFDVSQQVEDANRWVLHEVYDDPDAHAGHRRAPHFLAYGTVTQRGIVEKTVFRCVGRHVS
jgi:autoinducer 2-degrading protein